MITTVYSCMCSVYLLGKTSLYLFLSSAPGGTSAIVTMFEGMDCTEKKENIFKCVGRLW